MLASSIKVRTCSLSKYENSSTSTPCRTENECQNATECLAYDLNLVLLTQALKRYLNKHL